MVLLAHAIANHRNEIVMQILASPLMAAPLSLVVGKPGTAIATRDGARATVLDHAISAKNVVAIGLLAKLYAPWNIFGWVRWHEVLSTCSELDALPMMSPDLSYVTEDHHLVLFGHSLPRGLTPMGVARTCGREDRRDAAVAHLTAAIAMRAL